MWAEAGLNWSEFLPEDVDINRFVTEQVCGLYWCYTVNADY